MPLAHYGSFSHHQKVLEQSLSLALMFIRMDYYRVSLLIIYIINLLYVLCIYTYICIYIYTYICIYICHIVQYLSQGAAHVHQFS
jgi:hypothetical protein